MNEVVTSQPRNLELELEMQAPSCAGGESFATEFAQSGSVQNAIAGDFEGGGAWKYPHHVPAGLDAAGVSAGPDDPR